MDEKLNMIYEKILDLEIAIKDIQYEKERKQKEYEIKEIEYRIENLKYFREKQLENKAEMMSIFRAIDKQMQKED